MMNGRNQYICDYCGCPCQRSKIKSPENGRRVYWQRCLGCNTRYAVTSKGIIKRKILSCLDPKNNDISYQADVQCKYHRTIFIRTTNLNFRNKHGRIGHDQVMLMELPTALYDITPTNMYNKIKTYILFS